MFDFLFGMAAAEMLGDEHHLDCTCKRCQKFIDEESDGESDDESDDGESDE